MKLLEKQIQETCTQFLELDGWRALRTDPVSRRDWGKGFGELGMADHLYIRYRNVAYVVGGNSYSEVIWIEWKRLNKGGKPTKAGNHQRDWHKAERARGALTLIAGEDFPASIEGFVEWYSKSGLQRKKGLRLT